MSAPGKRSGAIDTLRECERSHWGTDSVADRKQIAKQFDAALADVVALLEAAKRVFIPNPIGGWDEEDYEAQRRMDALAAAVRQVERT